MRSLLAFLLVVAAAGPAFAESSDLDNASGVVVLRGSSAPPAPWYEPPPEQELAYPVYVPVYPVYFPMAHHRFLPATHHRLLPFGASVHVTPRAASHGR